MIHICIIADNNLCVRTPVSICMYAIEKNMCVFVLRACENILISVVSTGCYILHISTFTSQEQ